MRLTALVSLFALVTGPTFAAVEACDRVTHASHGGASDHRDLGRAKVAWVEWWSQEGVFKDVWLADCRSGIAMSLRTWEERIGDRHVIDRTDAVLGEIDHQAETAPAFFTIERMARDVRRDGVDMLITRYAEEFCACAAAYPDLRGSKTAFEGAL
jgi:hypothetical protein